jgi:hypothetical protein
MRSRPIHCILLVQAALALVLLLSPRSARADNITFGAASEFVILGLEGGSLEINSATKIEGNVGFSKNISVPNAQKVTTFDGTTYVYSGTATTNFNAKHDGSLSPVLYGSSPSGIGALTVNQLLDQANADALFYHALFRDMVPSTSLGNIVDDQDVSLGSSGPGANNVYSINSLNIKDDSFTLTGDASSSFIFNVIGNFEWSGSDLKLMGGLSASNVVFNFVDPASQIKILINKDTTDFVGTILAPNNVAKVEYHNPASFTGRIIASKIDVHSDFNITNPGDEGGPPPPVPLPMAAIGGGLLMGAVGLVRRPRRVAR